MSVRPAVMDGADGHFDGSATPWQSIFSRLGQLELGDDVSQASDLVEGDDEILIDRGEFCCDLGVGGGEGGNGSAIGISGSGQTCNGVGSLVVLVNGVGRRAGNGGGAVHVAGRGGLQIAPFLVGSGKEGLEFCPRLVVRRCPLPVFAVLDEHSCLKDELECVGYDLDWGVGIVACIRIFDGILNFFI